MLALAAVVVRFVGLAFLLLLVYRGSQVALVLVLALLCVAAETQAVLWRRLVAALEDAERWRVRALQALAASRDQP